MDKNEIKYDELGWIIQDRPQFAKNRSRLVVYGEYGYRIYGDYPSGEELQKIQEESKKHIEKCNEEKRILREAQMKHFQKLYEIEHPIETLLKKVFGLFDEDMSEVYRGDEN